jgi:mono/diheme cytochrome c family protein
MQFHFLPLVIGCLVAACALAPGCQNANEEELLNNSPCDTTAVTYTQHIRPILTAHCTRCHTGASAEAGWDLSQYSFLVQMQADAPGLLVGVVEHQTGFQAMPRSGPKLSRCDRDRIRAWIARGLPQ